MQVVARTWIGLRNLPTGGEVRVSDGVISRRIDLRNATIDYPETFNQLSGLIIAKKQKNNFVRAYRER